MSNRNGMQFRTAADGQKMVGSKSCVGIGNAFDLQMESCKWIQLWPPRVIGTATSDVLFTRAIFSLQAKNWQDRATSSTKNGPLLILNCTTSEQGVPAGYPHCARARIVGRHHSTPRGAHGRENWNLLPWQHKGLSQVGKSSKQLPSNSNLQPTVTNKANPSLHQHRSENPMRCLPTRWGFKDVVYLMWDTGVQYRSLQTLLSPPQL